LCMAKSRCIKIMATAFATLVMSEGNHCFAPIAAMYRATDSASAGESA
jgi:hypothetical protein